VCQGADLGELPSLEEVERQARALRSFQRAKSSPTKQDSPADLSTPQNQLKKNTPTSRDDNSGISRSQAEASCSSGNKPSSSSKTQALSSNKKPVKKDIWGRSGYKRRRRKRKRVEDGDGNELEDSVEVDDSVLDNDDEEEEDAENQEEKNEEDNEEEFMEVEAVDGTVTKSPVKSNPGSSEKRESSGKKSDSKLTEQLHVDVSDRAEKDKTKIPSPREGQRSPRAEGQRSSRTRLQLEDTPGRVETRRGASTEGRSKSPRGRNLSGEGRSKSPRGCDDLLPASVNGPISPKSAQKTVTEEGIIECSSGPKTPSSKTDTVDSKETDSASKSTKDKMVLNSAEKAAHLVNGFVDSGLGTSDSSGDSNDSVGQKLLEKKQQEMEQQVGGVLHFELLITRDNRHIDKSFIYEKLPS